MPNTMRNQALALGLSILLVPFLFVSAGTAQRQSPGQLGVRPVDA